ELSIVAPDGRTLCTDVGNQPEQRKVISSEPLSAGSRNLLELVRLGGQPARRTNSSRLRLPADNGSDEMTLRCSGWLPTSVHSVRPSGAMIESSLTGVVPK